MVSDHPSFVFRTQNLPEPGKQNSGKYCTCSGLCNRGDLEVQAFIDDSFGLGPEHLVHYQFEAFLSLYKELVLKLSSTPGHTLPPCGRLFRLHSEYIRSEVNVWADALSSSGTKPYKDIFRDHCRSAGGIPRERIVFPELFNFRM